jgi:putative membrane protein
MTEPVAPHAPASTLPRPSANGSAPATPVRAAGPRRRRLQTRIRGIRTGLIAGVAALIVVMISIIQNAHAANINFLGAHLRLSLAVTLLCAAIAGALGDAQAGRDLPQQRAGIAGDAQQHPGMPGQEIPVPHITIMHH